MRAFPLLFFLFLIGGCSIAPPVVSVPKSPWEALPGWDVEDHLPAWNAFLQSCTVLKKQEAWTKPCAEAFSLENPDSRNVREFFEKNFIPHELINSDGKKEGLITGYYEPLLFGSRNKTPRYRYPVYGTPKDLLTIQLGEIYPELKHLRLRGRLEGNKVVPYYDRKEIDGNPSLLGGSEILWVDNALELFFLQIQGSGRVQLDSGEMLRLGYADQNGRPYQSIGKVLVEKGEMPIEKASMDGIKQWAERHPEKLAELLDQNPSYVFFRLLPDNLSGPLGALGVALTDRRSLAVDPRSVVLGAPVFLSTTWPASDRPLNQLMLAQDTGGAIRGNVRADFFWGFGNEAGELAGKMKQSGRMWELLPIGYPLPIK